jgi:hypothetical protein
MPVEREPMGWRVCGGGSVILSDQPGHPHGLCSTIWMGEVALCRPRGDSEGALARLKAMTDPYPEQLREAFMRRFQREILFSIENAADPRSDRAPGVAAILPARPNVFSTLRPRLVPRSFWRARLALARSRALYYKI